MFDVQVHCLNFQGQCNVLLWSPLSVASLMTAMADFYYYYEEENLQLRKHKSTAYIKEEKTENRTTSSW